MKKFILATSLLAAPQAFAQQDVQPQPPAMQQPSQPSPQQQFQAMSQSVLDLTSQNISLRAQLIAAQTELKKAQDDLAADKKPAAK